MQQCSIMTRLAWRRHLCVHVGVLRERIREKEREIEGKGGGTAAKCRAGR